MTTLTIPCSQRTTSKSVTSAEATVRLAFPTPSPVEQTARVVGVRTRFGLPAESSPGAMMRNIPSAANSAPAEVCLPFAPAHISLIMGPSGAGKTSLLRQVARANPHARAVADVTFAPAQAVVDQVLSPGELIDALGILTQCGLGEPRLWLRRFDDLSVGEQLRARLARAVGLAQRDSAPPLLLCDEFAAALDRRQARALAHSLRRLVTRTGLCLVVASTRGDLVVDLQPDCVVLLRRPGRALTVRRKPQRRALSLLAGLEIVEGSRRDYDRFAEMHYRRRDELGFVDRVFLLRRRAPHRDKALREHLRAAPQSSRRARSPLRGRAARLRAIWRSSGDDPRRAAHHPATDPAPPESPEDEPLGIVVYSYPPLELALRNAATGGRYSGNPARLNRDLRTLRRLVLIPDLRGCGLAQLLVRRTLPRLGVPLVECLANMGDVNPVFERAGMRRVGRCALPESQRRIALRLHELGADPQSADFAAQVARRPEVRRVVAEGVYRWYCGITSAHAARARVTRQSPAVLAETWRQVAGSRPVYYLWERAK